MSMTLADTEAAYLAKLKAIVDAADAADAPINAQITALQKQLSAAKDPTIAKARHRYRQLSPKTTKPVRKVFEPSAKTSAK